MPARKQVPVGDGMRRKKMHKRKMEFSKLIVAWALVSTTCCMIAAAVLSSRGYDGFAEVANTALDKLVPVVVLGYNAANSFLKNSRNKYGIDVDGNPIKNDDEALG